MKGMESCDSPPPSEYQSSHEARTKYQGIRAHHFHTMINGNISNVKNSHRPTKTVVGILGFVAIGLVILVAVLVTHYEDGSQSGSSSSSAAAQAASSSLVSSKPTTTIASPPSSIRSSFPPKTTTPGRTKTNAISTVTTPEVETVTSLAASGFVTFISTCIWGCPRYACADVNDCRDPYCCINGTCDSQQATCGPAADCSSIYLGVC